MGLADSSGVPRVPEYSGANSTRCPLRLRGCHPLWPAFPCRLTVFHGIFVVGPTTPWRLATPWFGLFPLRSPLLRESSFLSSPAGTEMFQFPTFASNGLCIQPRMTGVSTRRVSPFGHRRIIACSRLPDAFRSVPRPSSPPDAKASTVSPF